MDGPKSKGRYIYIYDEYYNIRIRKEDNVNINDLSN